MSLSFWVDSERTGAIPFALARSTEICDAPSGGSELSSTDRKSKEREKDQDLRIVEEPLSCPWVGPRKLDGLG